MGQALWTVQPGQGMMAEVRSGLRLLVVPTMTPQSVRFVVESHLVRSGRPTSLVSGYRESVGAAMRAAENAAECMDFI